MNPNGMAMHVIEPQIDLYWCISAQHSGPSGSYKSGQVVGKRSVHVQHVKARGLTKALSSAECASQVFTCLNNNNTCIQRRNSRFFTILHCAVNHLQHVRSSDLDAIMCKSRATYRALITCNMSCYMPRGMKGQLSY